MKQTVQHETIMSLKTQMLVESLKAFERAEKQNALQIISVPAVKLDKCLTENIVPKNK